MRGDAEEIIGPVKVTWLNTVPDEIVQAFAPYARWMAEHSPPWLVRLVIEYNSLTSNNDAVEVRTSGDYRKANVLIYPGWLDARESLRFEHAVHELVHIYHTPLDDFFHDLKAVEFKDRDDVWRARCQQYTRANEQTTVDLTALFMRVLPPIPLGNYINHSHPTIEDTTPLCASPRKASAASSTSTRRTSTTSSRTSSPRRKAPG